MEKAAQHVGRLLASAGVYFPELTTQVAV